MKKVVISILFLCVTVFARAQNTVITVQGGYSWLNGIIGGEIQMGHIGLSGGYYPAKMPKSGDAVSSYSFAVSWYDGMWDEKGLYASIGVASAGYRSEKYTSSGVFNSDISSMTIFMLGYKYASSSGFNAKTGLGYGWCDKGKSYTWEFMVGYSF